MDKVKTMSLLLAMIGIFIFGFVAGGLLSQLFVGEYPIADKYEVFRDILVIVLSLSAVAIALLGWAVYQVISRGLDDRIKRTIDEELNVHICNLCFEFNHIYWKHYERVDYKIGNPLEGTELDYLQLAIDISESAARRAGLLDQKKFDALVCVAKNNLAYHLAMRGWSADSKRAMSLAKYAYDRADNYDYRDTCRWVETHSFTLLTFGNKEEREEGVNIVKQLLDREDLPDFLRENMERKYRKVLPK